MKLLIVYVLCFAAVTVVLSEVDAPVFSLSEYEASVSCVLRDGQPILTVRASGPNAVAYSLTTGQGHDDKFEIHSRTGTISSNGERNYCSNTDIDFGLKAIATDRNTKNSSTVNVNVILRPLSGKIVISENSSSK